MKRFSQRKGITPVSNEIQVGAMNEELRNSLWNVFDVLIWSSKDFMWVQYGKPGINNFSENLWFHFYKQPIDSRPEHSTRKLAIIREKFFSYEWYEVYDFIEFVISKFGQNQHLVEALNAILERELAGYRIISGNVVDITGEQEVVMLEEALKDTRFEGVNAHLKRALELLSDRKSPDYRNSIKESISAVESIAKIISDNPKATLGDALKILEKNNKLHPALKNGFSSLYGYTSDENGVRHSMLEEPNLTIADAKYFLLSCTSFVNYLKSNM